MSNPSLLSKIGLNFRLMTCIILAPVWQLMKCTLDLQTFRASHWWESFHLAPGTAYKVSRSPCHEYRVLAQLRYLLPSNKVTAEEDNQPCAVFSVHGKIQAPHAAVRLRHAPARYDSRPFSDKHSRFTRDLEQLLAISVTKYRFAS